MKGFIGHICLIVFISLIWVPRALAQESAPGKLLIKFKDQTSIRKDSEISFTVPFINQKITLREEGVVLAGKKDTALEGAVNLTPNISNDSPIISVDVKDDSKVQESINKYKNDPRVEYVESDQQGSLSWEPSDPNYTNGTLKGLDFHQWNFAKINMPAAWDITRGGSPDIKVAIIDTGLAYENYNDGSTQYIQAPDFANTRILSPKSFSIWEYPNKQCSDGIYNPVSTVHANDESGHGTHVTGTIAESSNNNIASAGIAYNTTIIPIKVWGTCQDTNGYWHYTGGQLSETLAAMDYAIDQGANVINMSISFLYYSQSLHDAVVAATNQNITVVAASGNISDATQNNRMTYPAGYPESVAVGAHTFIGKRSSFSLFGPVNENGITNRRVDLLAPGGGYYSGQQQGDLNDDGEEDNIVQQTITMGDPSRICQNNECYFMGTSMATPHVTGVVALMLSVNPNLTPAQIKDILKSTAQTSVIPGYNTLEYGAGLLDAYAAVNAANSLNPSPTLTPTPTPTVTIVPTPTPTTPTVNTNSNISDYWDGNATLQHKNKLTQETTGWAAGFDSGVHVEVVGNAWYLFTRKVDWGNKPSYCQINETMHIEVRKSTDEGATWSNPISAISNIPNTAWECAATDGDAYYNSTENKWHYLFQCLDRQSKWNGCHATRDGTDPYGIFTPATNNPVIDSGEIWSKICDTSNKDCVSLSQNAPVHKVVDEGTFDIFDYQSGNYFVDFHGYDGTNGYRGIAKTPDFQTWTVVAPDAILDLKDARNFSTTWDSNGPIGFGAGRIVKQDGNYYLISEAADKNLSCAAGQKWVWGMFRSQDISSTSWQSLPRINPFFTASDFPDTDPNLLPCNPSYMGIFISASGKTYMHASRPSYDPKYSGIYFYTIEPIVNSPTPTTPAATATPTATPTPIPLPGDLNNDHVVNMFDYNLFISKFGDAGGTADFDSSGKVDIFDYAIFVSNFGKTI